MELAMMERIRSMMTPEEVEEALWMVGAFERRGMPTAEADEWRRRIVARQGFLEMDGGRRRTARIGMTAVLQCVPILVVGVTEVVGPVL